jgi:NADPH:quinone reductase-like Zn-dependent oxidoreductase
MLAAYAARLDAHDPLAGLEVGERPEPAAREHWTTIEVRAASLNHHDLWSLRGVGLPAERLPMTLGTDAAGVTPDGRDVVVHGVIGATGHGVGPTEGRSLLSERYQGTFAQRVAVPTWNLLPKPPEISFTEASCLPTAWLTAYRMLFTSANAAPGDRVLVQGAGGGVSTAAVLLGAAAGLEVHVTSRDEGKRARALALGAASAVEPGGRLPAKVDVVLETVGAATWGHSVDASGRDDRRGGGHVRGRRPGRADPHLLPGDQRPGRHHGLARGLRSAAQPAGADRHPAAGGPRAAAGPGTRGAGTPAVGGPVRQGRAPAQVSRIAGTVLGSVSASVSE